MYLNFNENNKDICVSVCPFYIDRVVEILLFFYAVNGRKKGGMPSVRNGT